jgi:hypothetical protein
MDPDRDSGGPKTCGTGGSGSSKLRLTNNNLLLLWFLPDFAGGKPLLNMQQRPQALDWIRLGHMWVAICCRFGMIYSMCELSYQYTKHRNISRSNPNTGPNKKFAMNGCRANYLTLFMYLSAIFCISLNNRKDYCVCVLEDHNSVLINFNIF